MMRRQKWPLRVYTLLRLPDSAGTWLVASNTSSDRTSSGTQRKKISHKKLAGIGATKPEHAAQVRDRSLVQQSKRSTGMNVMTQSIQAFAASRDLKWIFHFTRQTNLDSIMSKGLLTRKKLTQDGSGVTFNDDFRHDGTDAICASISFPNYRMFYSLRQKDTSARWAIVYFNVEILWKLDCAFCQTNAASSSVSATPILERCTDAALRGMFAEVEGPTRIERKLGNEFTTDPQAEVLFLQGIPKEFIAGIIVETAQEAVEIAKRYQGIRVVHRPDYFSYRSDWTYWKTATTHG